MLGAFLGFMPPFMVARHRQGGAVELVEMAKTTPGGLAVAYAGPGDVTHLPSELLRQASGAQFLYGPCKSDVESLSDLVGHRIGAAHYHGPLAVPQVRAGRLRATASVQRRIRDTAIDTPG